MLCATRGITLVTLMLITIVSTYLTVCCLSDIMGEQLNRNYTTRPRMEEMILAVEDDLFELEKKKFEETAPKYYSPFFGYDLYYKVMKNMGNHFTPSKFQLAKVLIVSVSLVHAIAASYAIFSILVIRLIEGRGQCWVWYTTSLILMSSTLFLGEVLIVVLLVLIYTSPSSGYSFPIMGISILLQILIVIAGSLISSFYSKEKDRLESIYLMVDCADDLHGNCCENNLAAIDRENAALMEGQRACGSHSRQDFDTASRCDSDSASICTNITRLDPEDRCHDDSSLLMEETSFVGNKPTAVYNVHSEVAQHRDEYVKQVKEMFPDIDEDVIEDVCRNCAAPVQALLDMKQSNQVLKTD